MRCVKFREHAHLWALGTLLVASCLGVVLCIGGGFSDSDQKRKTLLVTGLISFILGALAAGGLCLLHWTFLSDREPFLLGGAPMRDPDENVYAWCGCVLFGAVATLTTLAVFVAQVPASDL